MTTRQTTKSREDGEEDPTIKEVRQVRSRRTVGLIMNKCPLCDLPYTEFSQVNVEENKAFFQLVQFGTNPDGTGYESYHCQHCDRFFMMIVSIEPVMAEYKFKPAHENKPKGGISDLFAQIFGGGGNGEG